MTNLNDIAVIIPVGSGEREWINLVPDLENLPSQAEILFVATEPLPADLLSLLSVLSASGRRVEWIVWDRGRARQMNQGAASTRRPFLWFLHADSRFSQSALHALATAIAIRPRSLHYFNLAFRSDGPKLATVNAIGTWFRSHAFGIPFGDQGFCVSRDLFNELGGFREDAPFGEDHLFVWQARHYGVPLNCTGATLFTSARKYRDQGWLYTTVQHFFLTYRQAIPELFRLLKSNQTCLRFLRSPAQPKSIS